MKWFYSGVRIWALSTGLLSFGLRAEAQRYFKEPGRGYEHPSLEVGLGGGVSVYQGDLASPKRGSFKDAAPFGNAFLRYHVGSGFSAQLNFSGGGLKGDDSQWPDPEYRQHRNFKFTATLLEGALIAEYDFLKRYALAHPKAPFGLYAFGGLGFAYTHVKRDFSRLDAAYFGADDPALKWRQDAAAPAGNTALVLPLGAGVSCRLGATTGFFIEGGYRLALTDKLDGFSYSVASADNDSYVLYKAGVTFGLPNRSARLSAE